MTDFAPPVTGSGAKAAIQRGGAFLAGMIMPNLGAFIAWGLVTALFIPNGWINLIGRATGALPEDGTFEFTDQASAIVGPIIVFLLPILIGYTGGKLVHGTRGAVVGALATVGVIVSPLVAPWTRMQIAADALPETIADLGPQFLGAIVIGPLTALILKQWDRLIEGKLKSGFEMLVDNFASAIIGGVMALVGVFWIGPLVFAIASAFGAVVDWLVDISLLPLVSIVIEPAKVLFLNNALNHGVLTPLGAEQVAESGKSMMFMLESNPGPGAGVLLAMMLFGPAAIRPTVPSALVVQFLGGIHEIYFPYVLMKPVLVIAAIAGGATAVLWEVIFSLGLLAPAAPGSVIAWILVSPPSDLFLNMVAILLAAGVALLVGGAVLGFGRSAKLEMDLEAARAQNAASKAESKGQAAQA